MRKSTKIVTAAAVAGLAFAGVSAFTASNTQPATSTTGYGTTTVSGAVVNSIAYALNGTGATIETTSLVLDGNTTGSAVSMAYNGGNSFTCGTGAYDEVDTETTYTCDGGDLATGALTATHVIVN